MSNLAKRFLRAKAPPEKIASINGFRVFAIWLLNSFNGRRNVVWRVSDHLVSLR